jgi:hypothetical protein
MVRQLLERGLLDGWPGQGRGRPGQRPPRTILHLLGIDHERLTYRHSGRDFRLTDVHGKVVGDLLA